MFHKGETLLYSSAGHTSYVKVEDIFINDDGVLWFKVPTTSNKLIKTSRELLHNPSVPDIGFILLTGPKMQATAEEIPAEQLEEIANPVKLSPLQEE